MFVIIRNTSYLQVYIYFPYFIKCIYSSNCRQSYLRAVKTLLDEIGVSHPVKQNVKLSTKACRFLTSLSVSLIQQKLSMLPAVERCNTKILFHCESKYI